MRNKFEILMNNKKAITLISLVVTIVVLVILAAVAINIAIGNNGLLNKTKLAKGEYVNAADKERKDIDVLTNDIDATVGSRQTSDQKLLELEARIAALEAKDTSKIEVVKKSWGNSTVKTVASTETLIETISFAGKGTGKAIVTVSAGCENTTPQKFELELFKNTDYVATDTVCESSANYTFLRSNATAIIDYNENTNINIKIWTNIALTPAYCYQVIIIPD